MEGAADIAFLRKSLHSVDLVKCKPFELENSTRYNRFRPRTEAITIVPGNIDRSPSNQSIHRELGVKDKGLKGHPNWVAVEEVLIDAQR